MAKEKGSARFLSDNFVSDLTEGILLPVMKAVRLDDNLCLEIRREYVNVYYRGGNLLRITAKPRICVYNFDFDLGYVNETSPNYKQIDELPTTINSQEQAEEWRQCFPTIKMEMDVYFSTRGKLEREFQQLIIRENNMGRTAKSTDYYICDIEYVSREGRFDLIAAKETERGKYRLALMEMKYLDGALNGTSGLCDHIEKANCFLVSHDVGDLKTEMMSMLKLKKQLGILDHFPKEAEFTDEKPEFVFLFANHQPQSAILNKELQLLKKKEFYPSFCQLADLKFALANHLGYGLYRECIYSFADYERILEVLGGKKP